MIFQAPKRMVNRVFLHCSASDSDMAGQELVDEIRRWHVEGNGWSDIGYTFVIDRQGEIMPGRSLEKTPAAQKGHNLKTIAICIHGLTFSETWPRGAQAAAVIGLAGQINVAMHGIVAFHGHCEVSNKACPVVEYKTLLGLDRWSRMP